VFQGVAGGLENWTSNYDLPVTGECTVNTPAAATVLLLVGPGRSCSGAFFKLLQFSLVQHCVLLVAALVIR
jgi:hypothetical protein